MSATATSATHARAGELLRRLTGDPGASFREGQWEAIERLVEGGRVLVVQRTGWGKSAVYFIATRLLRDAGAGPTILVSPLLALMRNQLLMAERAGVRAATINSENPDDWEAIEAAVDAGELDLLLISPERLNNHRFRTSVLPQLVRTVGLLVVDEAHCISDWGHDFRPDYRRISRVLQALPRTVPVLCTTATANQRVIDDVVAQLGDSLEVVRGPLGRPSLALSAVDLPSQAQRLAWLATVLPTLPGSGIVYCLTVHDTERVASWLRGRGIDARAYSGESPAEERAGLEQALLDGSVKALVATSALGMGFDKPDLGFVVHYQSPGSAVAYYQQVGRAGRALDTAHGVLLRGAEDGDIQDFFIRTAFPVREQAEAVVALLEERAEPMSLSAVEREVNVRHSRLEAMLKVLEVDGAVERAEGGWRRTLQSWSYDEERATSVTALRRAEQAAMRDYGSTDGCRMAFLRTELDDAGAEPCGRCDRCTGASPWPAELDPTLVAAATTHLRGGGFTIEPRKQWPPGLAAVRGRIPPDRQLRPGRALGRYGDGGWGALVKRARLDGGRVPDDLLDAAVELVGRWQPDPPPAWVTCVPSASNPGLVADLGARLAAGLGLPFADVVRRVRGGPPQSAMENSAQQVGNVASSFEVDGTLPDGPVLLVDDTVASGWTLTVVGSALREAGSGPVHPFALGKEVGG